jgi:hypothetical protein
MIHRIFLASLFVLVSACNQSEPIGEPYSFTELAMTPGMTIKATNKNGHVTIEYIHALERCYKWDNQQECRGLIPREEQWDGKLGAYNPGEAFVWEIFDTRIVTEDSQLRFANASEALAWLQQGKNVMDWVYTDDGLVVGFAKIPKRNQINIEVYQIYINEHKPDNLPGSTVDRIRVMHRNKSLPGTM